MSNNLADPDPFNTLKVRGNPISSAVGYRDTIYITTVAEILKDKYIEYVKKGKNKKAKGKKESTKEPAKPPVSARTKHDLCVYITKKVNMTATTTPLDPLNDCKQFTNLLAKYEKKTAEMLVEHTGDRSEVNLAKVAFGTQFKTFCIDIDHEFAWCSFYSVFKELIADDPNYINPFKRSATDWQNEDQPNSNMLADNSNSSTPASTPASKKQKVDENTEDKLYNSISSVVDIIKEDIERGRLNSERQSEAETREEARKDRAEERAQALHDAQMAVLAAKESRYK